MYRWGVAKRDMRVSALIHETSWHAREFLQVIERDTYNQIVARIPGVSTFNHCFDEGGIIPRTLPFAFKNWKEYRDYLLIHITKPEYWDLFKKRWEGQDGDDFYKVHVKEIVINDIDGTVNENYAWQQYGKKRLESKYKGADKEKFKKYMEEKGNDKRPANI